MYAGVYYGAMPYAAYTVLLASFIVAATAHFEPVNLTQQNDATILTNNAVSAILQ